MAPCYTLIMTHAVHDAIGLALAQHVAAGLPMHPEWIDLAQSNLDRWSRRNHDSPTLLACYREWQSLLERPLDEVRAILLDPTSECQRLRQNSPFVGVLSPSQVWQIKRQIHEALAT